MTDSLLKDGLLLLLKAAEKIDRESSKSTYHHSEWWETRTESPGYFYADGSKQFCSPYSSSSSYRRSAPSTRCTHNELEKSRRAHLRTCMDALKELLVFDSEAARITTLSILRKAASTIQQLQQRNEYLEACEDGEKQRFSQLMKRRQALRKKMDTKRSRSLKAQDWRERNRNYSECSVLTTSSEDSEMDYGSRLLPPNTHSISPLSHRQQQQHFSANDNHPYASPYEVTAGVVITVPNSTVTKAVTTSAMVPDSTTASQAHNPSYRRKVALHSLQTSADIIGMGPTDAYDTSSSDSGFDEHQAFKMDSSTVSNTEEVVYTACHEGNCFKAH